MRVDMMQLRSMVAVLSLIWASEAYSGVGLGEFVIEPPDPSLEALQILGPSRPPDNEDAEGISTVWPVSINRELFLSDPDAVIVTIPDRLPEVLFRTRSSRIGSEEFQWTGRSSFCSAYFSKFAHLRMTLSCEDGTYDVALVNGGTDQRLAKFDASHQFDWDESFPALSVPLVQQVGSKLSGTDESVDILVLYTSQVRQLHDALGGVANVRQLARDSVGLIQETLDNSTSSTDVQPAIAEVRLVAAREAVSSASLPSLSDDLIWMTTATDLLGLREKWRADIVLLLTTYRGSGQYGLANLPGYSGFPTPGPAGLSNELCNCD